jgi:A/G-specific adenine glycosylase
VQEPPQPSSGAAGTATAAGELLAWFDRQRRDLPWRRTVDPYRIWLSEVMLQQTRVETVLPYYERFLAQFPTVDRLAAAPLEEVLAAWSGLGYYGRARQLHAAARLVAAAGEFPRTLEELLELPGVGAYTAAALASIAFGLAVPVLDGNVERVMARRLVLDEDPRRRGARARLLAGAAALLDPTRPGDSNQALMELGATLCLPRRPRCLLCPLRPGCGAAREGQPERYPPPRRKRPGESWRLLVVVVTRGDRVLLYRRARTSPLLAGTWELPWLELDGGQTPLPGLLARKYGGRWQLGSPIAAVRHGITYRDLRVTVCLANRSSGHASRKSWPEEATRQAGGQKSGVADEVRERPEASKLSEKRAGRDAEEPLESGWFDARQRSALPMSSLVGKVLRACSQAPLAGKGLGGAWVRVSEDGDSECEAKSLHAGDCAPEPKRSRPQPPGKLLAEEIVCRRGGTEGRGPECPRTATLSARQSRSIQATALPSRSGAARRSTLAHAPAGGLPPEASSASGRGSRASRSRSRRRG